MMEDRLGAKVKILTFSPSDDKIRAMLVVPDNFEGRKIAKRLDKLDSWKVIAKNFPRLDLESELPIKDYEVVVNPIRTDRENEFGKASKKAAFWLNAGEGPSQVPTSVKCGGKIPCFEFRSDDMSCDFYDKDAFGKAQLVCWTGEK